MAYGTRPGDNGNLPIFSPNEDSPDEPIKLLEVIGYTFETGQVDAFSFSLGPDIPYRSVVATVTPNEFQHIRRKEINLPAGWDLQNAQQIYPDSLNAATEHRNADN